MQGGEGNGGLKIFRRQITGEISENKISDQQAEQGEITQRRRGHEESQRLREIGSLASLGMTTIAACAAETWWERIG
jgi:hypothetical protein